MLFCTCTLCIENNADYENLECINKFHLPTCIMRISTINDQLRLSDIHIHTCVQN